MYGLIYCITNTVNGKQYVGQTTYTIKERWGWPLKSAPFSPTCAINSAVRKYGPESFTIVQIDEAESQDELNEKEVHHIARLDTYGGGYNLTPGGKKHFKHSPETRRKISQSNLGNVVSEKTKRKISQTMLGRIVLEETRKKLSAVKLGRLHTEESKKWMSLARLGHKTRPCPEETKQKISRTLLGHVHSEESKQKMSIALKQERCKRGHLFDKDNIFMDSRGGRNCFTCYYLRNGKKLPIRFQKYVTGKEVYVKRVKKEKIAHVAQA